MSKLERYRLILRKFGKEKKFQGTYFSNVSPFTFSKAYFDSDGTVYLILLSFE